MSRIALLFTILSLLFFAACEKKETTPDTDTDNIGTDDGLLGDEDGILPEEEPDTDIPTTCKLEDSFFEAMPTEWTAFFTMKMSGLINDPDNQDPDFAFLTKIGATLKGEEYNLGDNYGMYMLDSVQTTDGTTMPAVLAVGVGNLTWPVTNKLAALWAGQTFVVVDDLLNWKEQAELEGQTGVSVEGTYQVAIFEVWIGISGSTQTTRMECIRGLSAMNAEETAFDGAMFVCTDTNTEWAIGEQMKMMDYSKMIDDETELLAAMNEGLETSDPNYRTDVCRCWAADGTTIMDCEDMKDEFGVGELPDEETDDITDDGEVTDTIDTDIEPDASDIIDIDTDIIETEDDLTGDDDIIIVTPCDPNPCTAIDNSDGVCTVDNLTFSCGCDANYSWDGDSCEADTRRTDCVNIPVNAHGTGDNADGKFAQTWDGTAWLPASVVCTFECDNNYTWNGTDTCVADSQTVACTNTLPLHAGWAGANFLGQITQTWDGTAWDPASDTCMWTCDLNYSLNGNGDGCDPDTRTVNCTNIPANAAGIGDNADGKIDQTWNGSDWEPADNTCLWACDVNYTENGAVCDADTRTVACTNIPLNATGTGDNADGQIDQTWNGTIWAPADNTCTWDCDATYHLNGEICDPDTRNIACTNILPENASWTASGDYLGDGTVDQTWDGTTYMPKRNVCPWTCDLNYTENNGVCDPDTRTVLCTNIPQEHAHGTGDNADGQIDQTWDGDSWEPADNTCTFECDTNYVLNGLLCEAGTQRAACTNIPANAHGIDANDDGKFLQTWDGDSWEPATFVCSFACDTNYTWNGTDACDPDTRTVDCTNIPAEYATGIDDNADGKMDQTWNGTDWAPAANTCTWVCFDGYRLNETEDGCVWQPVIYVDIDATGTGTGYSWADAYLSLSDAIEDATIGQEIWVATGIYHPTTCTTNWQECDADPTNLRLYNFTMKLGVAIYGGFDGTEEIVAGDIAAARTLRDWEANVTTLSADLNGDDNWNDGTKSWENRTDNTHHVFSNFPGELDATAILDGFVITGGQADLEPYNTGGGGVNLGATDNPTIRNCSFVGNVAISSGGAINAYDTPLTIENCSFDRNIASGGGAISLYGTALTVTNCSFTGNRTAAPDNNQRGGAIYTNTALSVSNSDFIGNYTRQEGSVIATNPGATVTIDNCLFDQNSYLTTAGDGYLIRIADAGTLTVSNSTFTNNTGISLAIRESTGTVTNTRFEDNIAINAGAIEAPSSNLTVTGCKFIGNEATIAGSGFAQLAGAIFINGMTDAGDPIPGLIHNITNSEFRNNTAGLWGGALLIIRATPTITNCTFDGNADSGSDAIKLAESNAIFNNTILWDEVGQIAGPVGPYTFAASVPVFTNSDVYGCGGSGAWVAACGTDGGNNIDADPLFVGGVGTDPFDLQATSPCVNTGSNALVPEGILYDIMGIGNDRIQNTTVDMGAYEQ